MRTKDGRTASEWNRIHGYVREFHADAESMDELIGRVVRSTGIRDVQWAEVDEILRLAGLPKPTRKKNHE